MKIKKTKIVKTIIIVLIIISFICLLKFNAEIKFEINVFKNKIIGRPLTEDFNVKIKSGNLATDYDIPKVLDDIDKFQLNTVNIPVVININSLSSSKMSVDETSKRKAIELIMKLSDKNISIILEPYPWIKNGELYETDWAPEDIDEFFWNWKNDVLKVLIDEVAVPYHVDALNIASNFVHMEYAEGYWCDIIDFVRENYDGLVTYRTCWWSTAHWDERIQEEYQKKLNNKLFSKVDFISVAAYFELTDRDENTTEDLVKAIISSEKNDRKQNIKKEIQEFNNKWDKPIFFGELGFPRRNKAATEPWNPLSSTIVNDKEQARCFEAYRRTFEDEDWLLGFSVFAIGSEGKDKNYYPSKESTEVIKKWYKLNNSEE